MIHRIPRVAKISMIAPLQGIRSRSSLISDESSSAILSREGVLIACLAPAVIYVFIHGQTVHFVYLFVGVLLVRVAMFALSDITKCKPTNVSVASRSVRSGTKRDSMRLSKTSHNRAGTVSRSAMSHETVARLERSSSLKNIAPPTPTTILSNDDPHLKLRRSILNKVSPDKLDDLVEKLVDTFDLSSDVKLLDAQLGEFIGLVFAAASRQPQYITVFANLMGNVVTRVKPTDPVDEILLKQAQMNWASICLTPVEKTKGWEEFTPDDKADARTRHRAKQLAIAEFCGLLSAYELIPASSPLSWLETLMSILSKTVSTTGCIPKESSTESAVEIISCTLKGLGPSEATGLLTDLDQHRFEKLCERIFSLPVTSSRVKCLLRDLHELRESGWSKLPMWKRALVPSKRCSL